MMNLDARIIISAADQASKVFKAIGGNAQGLSQRLDSVGKSMMVTGSILTASVTAPVLAFAVKSMNTAKAFEGQMVELRKEVSAMPVDQFEALSKSLRAIPRQLPVESLADVMAAATQAAEFGVAADSLKDFMQTAATMSVAIGQPLQQVTKSLAETSKAFGLDAKQIAHVADAVQFYADALSSSESDVLAFVQSTASLSRTMNVSAETAAALGAAMMSQGMSVSDAGTAYEALMKRMATSKGMKAAAKIAGMTSKQFKKAWGEDAGGALLEVIEHVSKLKTVQEQQAALAEIVPAKQAAALLPLVRAYAQLAAAQEEAARGGVDGALSAKTAEQIKTYESQAKMLGAALYDLQVEVGTKILPRLTPLLQSLRGVIEEWTSGPEGAKRVDLAAKLGLTAAVVGPALIVAGVLTRSLVTLASAIRAVSLAAVTLGGAATIGFGGLVLLAGAIGLAAWERWPEIAGNMQGFADSAYAAGAAAMEMAKGVAALDQAETARSAHTAARELDKATKNAIVSGAEVSSQIYSWLGFDGLAADLDDFADRWRKKLRGLNMPEMPGPGAGLSAPAPGGAPTGAGGLPHMPASVGYAAKFWEWWNRPAPQMPYQSRFDSNSPSHREPLPVLPASRFEERPGPVVQPVSPDIRSLLEGIRIDSQSGPRAVQPVSPDIYSLLKDIRIEPPEFAPGSLDQALAGKVEAEIKGQADVSVRIQVDGGRIAGTSATSSGNIRPRVGVDNTGAPPRGTERF